MDSHSQILTCLKKNRELPEEYLSRVSAYGELCGITLNPKKNMITKMLNYIAETIREYKARLMMKIFFRMMNHLYKNRGQ